MPCHAIPYHTYTADRIKGKSNLSTPGMRYSCSYYSWFGMSVETNQTISAGPLMELRGLGSPEAESDDSLRWSPKLPSVWSWIVSPSTSYLDLWVTSSRPQTIPTPSCRSWWFGISWDDLGILGESLNASYLLVNIPTISWIATISNAGGVLGNWGWINGWCAAAPGTARKQKGGARSRWWRHLSWQVPELSRAQLPFFQALAHWNGRSQVPAYLEVYIIIIIIINYY